MMPVGKWRMRGGHCSPPALWGRTAALLVATFVLFTISACDQFESSKDAPDDSSTTATTSTLALERAKENAGAAYNSARDYANIKKDEYAKLVREELRELEPKIDELKSRADAATTEVRRRLSTEIEDLEEKARNARTELEEIEKSTSEAWKDMRGGMDRAMKELREGYERAREHY